MGRAQEYSKIHRPNDPIAPYDIWSKVENVPAFAAR